MATDFDLTGKIAIVTGGNGGIGYGIAQGLAQAGADIVVAARQPAKNAQATANMTQALKDGSMTVDDLRAKMDDLAKANPFLAGKIHELTDKAIRRGVFKSVKDLVEAIQNYIKINNQNPKPFVWTKRVDQILEKVNHCKASTVTAH